MAHAQLSPSGASRWMACPGSVRLCADIPDTTSIYADEGTDAHELAAICLQSGLSPDEYLGRVMGCGNVVTTPMAQAVQQYVSYVRDLVQVTGGTLLVEQSLPIGDLTGEDGARGTSDAVILTHDEVIVVDLKFGMGVRVDAQGNPQMLTYGLAALREYDGVVTDFKRVRMVIHQPRLEWVSEWTQSFEEMADFGTRLLAAAQATRAPDAPLVPSESACRWCRAKATCPALYQAVVSEFDAVSPPDADPPSLAGAMAKVGLIEDWCKAIRAECESRLLDGQPVPGWKLVQGRKGARKWSDPQAVEDLLRKQFRLPVEQVYDMTLIGPTAAERLFESGTLTVGPRQWAKVTAMVVQTPGKPSVAPESDRRPALTVSPTTEEFSAVNPEA